MGAENFDVLLTLKCASSLYRLAAFMAACGDQTGASRDGPWYHLAPAVPRLYRLFLELARGWPLVLMIDMSAAPLDAAPTDPTGRGETICKNVVMEEMEPHGPTHTMHQLLPSRPMIHVLVSAIAFGADWALCFARIWGGAGGWLQHVNT
jgi:hypothetical protein